MSIAVTCPQCQTRFEVPGDLADQPIQCHKCLHVFERAGKKLMSAGIQAGAAPIMAATSKNDEEEQPPRPSPRHDEARAPFPVVPILIVLIGLLFFMLVVSVGFNVWVAVNPDQGFRGMNRAAMAEAEAQRQRAQAEQAAALAKVLQEEAQRKQADGQREVEELRQQNDVLTRENERLKAELSKLKRAKDGK